MKRAQKNIISIIVILMLLSFIFSVQAATLTVDKTTQGWGVRGWPNYIAMGGVTDSNHNNDATFADRPLDAIFKYAGDGGNGDPGRITFPIYTINTISQAQNLSAVFNRRVMPVMVVYTSEMSGGTNFKDFDYSNDYLTMHFINLMLESSIMQSYKTDSNPYPGSIVLNPDLLGMVQQQNLWTSSGTGPLNTTLIEVNRAVQKANWFANTRHDWNIILSSGSSITVTQKTPLEFIIYVRNGELRSQGVYSPWDIKTQWETAAQNLLAKAPADLNENLPVFENNFKGWIQATNWIIKYFGPDITFGWQSNVWSTGSSHWIHKDLSAQQIATSYSGPVADLWDDIRVYNGIYRPDFVVFDKYEMDAAAAAGIGYLWNQRDLNNYLVFAKSISDRLDNSPIMLWQIPGGHLQRVSNDVDTRESHGSTEPDYFFGDSELKPDLSNVQPYILNLALPQNIYGTASVKTYLTQNNQDWTTGHMALAKDSRVFSILWGGGSTTSIGKVGADDNGWLAAKIADYYKNPTYLDPQAPAELAAHDDTASTDMNKAVNISVLSNDSGSGLIIVGIGDPVHGKTSVTGSQITYTPEDGYAGPDKFSYTVSDDTRRQSTAYVNLTVNAIAVPVANTDIAETNVNTAVTVNVLANDTGNSLTISSIGNPSSGTVVIDNGKILYTPATGFSGTATFSYTAVDSIGQKATGNVTVTVNNIVISSPDVTFKVTSDWGSGFNSDMTLTNNTAYAFAGWTLEFDFPHDITSLWNGVIISHVGNHYIVKNAGWNAEVPVKGSVTIGFGSIYAGTITEPNSIKLIGISTETGQPVIPEQYSVTPSAGTGGTISPSTVQTVNHGSTTSFTVIPTAGYTATVGGTCGGTLSGTTYTTNAITGICTVSATFTQTLAAPISWGSNKIAALFSDYGSDSGIWSHDGSSWSRLIDWQPAQMIACGTSDIIASFNDYGSGNGLYRYNGSWSRITDWAPRDIVSYGGGNIAGKFSDYGSDGNGVWRYNGKWHKLTDWLPDSMTTLGDDILVGMFSQYSSGNGIYKHDGASWGKLTDWAPKSISSWGSRLTAVFTDYGSDGNGLWIYDGSWKRATEWGPSQLLSWQGDVQLATVFTDYGSGNGLWNYNGSSWTRLTDWVPTDMAKLGTEDLVAVFKDYGSDSGVWKYSSSSQSWQLISSWVPDKIGSSGDYITAVFTNYGSSGNGVWKYRNGTWTKLTDWTSKEPKP